MKIAISAMTHIGGSGKSENQDTFFHEQAPDGSAYLGVFDGHGDYGKAVAEAVRESFVAAGPNYNPVEAYVAADEAAKKAILTACPASRNPQVHENGTLYSTHFSGRPVILRGGTTASVVNIRDNKVTVSHVGDSEVMVIHIPTGEFSVLTKDHSTTSKEEFVRCQSAPVVAPITMANISYPWHPEVRPVFVKDAEGNYVMNPKGGFNTCNVRKDFSAYLRGTSPFGAFGDGESLNMLRAIGDFSLKRHGLISTPDVIEHDLKPGRTIVLTASDGLYDNFTYEGLRDLVVRIAVSGVPVTDLTDAVFSEGLKEGFKNFSRANQDNTTLVLAVVDIDEPLPATAAAEPEPAPAGLGAVPSGTTVATSVVETFTAALEAGGPRAADDDSEDTDGSPTTGGGTSAAAPAAAQPQAPGPEEEYDDREEYYEDDPYAGSTDDYGDYEDDGGWEQHGYYTNEINHGADMER